MDAILPAGGRIEGEFARVAGTEIKALIRFQNESLLQRAIETLKSTEGIHRIVVIGPEECRVAIGCWTCSGSREPSP